MAGKPRKLQLYTWSYSRYAMHDGCPYKFKLKVLMKMKEPSNYAMERGTAMHAKGEQFLLGKIIGVPPEYKKFKDEIKGIKKAGATPEADIFLNKQLEIVPEGFKGRWWFMAKIDADVNMDETEAVEIDFKTGKYYDSHIKQGEVYAWSKFCASPKVQKVYVEFWYLDSGEIYTAEYERKKDFKKLNTTWLNNAKVLFADTTFKKKKSWMCKNCHFSSKNGNGPCTN